MLNTIDRTLDARGLNCLLPILKARKAMNASMAGQTLQVIATDPGFEKDIGAFCRQTGDDLMCHEKQAASTSSSYVSREPRKSPIGDDGRYLNTGLDVMLLSKIIQFNQRRKSCLLP